MNAETAPLEETRQGTRALVLIIGVTVLLFLGLGAARLVQDEPAPDTSDLKVSRQQLPDDKNAFAILLAAGLRAEATRTWGGDEAEFFSILRGRSWNAEKVARWLAADESIPEDIRRAADLPDSQSPAKYDGARIRPVQQLFQLSILRARVLEKSGQRDAALAWLAVNLRAIQKLESARGEMIVWYLATSAHALIREEIERMILSGDFSAATARLLITTLEETRPGAEGVSDAIRLEHAQLKHVLASTDSHPLLKPHSTERIHAEFVRTFIGLVDANWAQIRAQAPNVEAFLTSNGWRWSPDNREGRKLLFRATPDLAGFLGHRLNLQSAISITQAAVAIRRHELEHGTLPATLADLVPTYLPTEPRDYFDGLPIRYSRDFRALWSTGKDGFTVTSPHIPRRRDPAPHLQIAPPPPPPPAAP